MAELTKSQNALIDSHSALEEEVARLSNKVLDLEDRSRRIPESVTPDQLHTFLRDLMAFVLPSCSTLDLTIDRVHRIPKPAHLPFHSPRDTIARIHFFQVKDEFLRSLRKITEFLERFRALSIFPDLSAATMLKRKGFAAYTKVLRDNIIQYRWGFPVKLIIYKDATPTICADPPALWNALQTWNLLSAPTNSPPRKRSTGPQAITPLWVGNQSKSRTTPGD